MKKIIFSAVAVICFCLTPVALAQPVALNGEVTLKYEKDKSTGEPSVSGTRYTLKLRGETDLGAGWSLYGRFAAQYATQPLAADFNRDAYPADRKGIVALDQFGLSHKTGGFVYKLGRQDVKLGLEGLLYCRSDEKVGKHVFVDGLSVSGTSGVIDISAVFAQEDNAGSRDNKLYVIRTGYNPSKNLNWGVTLGRYQSIGADSTNHWAVDGTYKFGKSSLAVQYTKSSGNADNKAYATSLNHDFDDKSAVSVSGFRVETNGSMGGQSDFDSGNKGLHYGFTHKLSEAASLEVVYKDQKTIDGGQKNSKLEATFSQTF